MSSHPLKKILLKYSGEAVAGAAGQGIDPKILHFMSREIKSVVEKNVSVGLVIGGGNLFRGQELNQDGIDRVAGDHMGMLATVMNGIALRDALERAASDEAPVGVSDGGGRRAYHGDGV